MQLCLVPLNPTVGDLPGNSRAIEAAIARTHGARADAVVFPELAICGYPPKDLLLHEGFVEACEAAARRAGAAATGGLAVIIGCPCLAPGSSHAPGPSPARRVTNSLLVFQDGRLAARYDKRLLPTYDVFDEDRYFAPGTAPGVVELRTRVGRVWRLGLAICEDLWKGEDAGFDARYASARDPIDDLAAARVDALISPSASPFVLGKGRRHRDILTRHAARLGVPVVSVNQSGGNDELVFDGHAVAYDARGALLCAAAGFDDAPITLALDAPRAPSIADPLLEHADERLLFRALVRGTRDYLAKTGFKAAVLGLSGGIDSAVTAAIAAAAIGPANVTGLLMPSVYSSAHSIADAEDLARRLGLRAITTPIEPPVRGFRAAIDPAFKAHALQPLGEKLPDLTEENLQSRVRGTILMAWSNRTGAIVLTTGNKSELAVGYCTLYGDMNGGLAVLSDVSKQWVYRLARWLNACHADAGFAMPPIPQSSIDKAPSAELRPDQTDQDSLPPYDVLDAIIERLVEGRQSPERAAAELGFDPALVRRVARMIALAEYKRTQSAIGLKVTSVAFGSGRRMPLAQRWGL